MNYYPHHIGDFDRATRHLSRTERSVYRDLLDLYYDTEAQIPLDRTWLCRKILARSNEESTAVEQVLNEFFTQTPTGWYQVRCDEEIAQYHSNTSQKSVAGKASAASRALKKQQAANGASTCVEQPLPAVATKSNGTPTNQEPEPEPLTNEETKEKTPAAPAFVLPKWIPADTWAAYLQTRKARKAKNEPHALGLIVKDLADIREKGHDPVEVLNNSIKSGWAGVFEPKTLAAFAQVKADVGKTTVSLNPDVEATRQRVAADAAIPRNGPSLAVLAQMAALRGQRQAA
jgi:uncharacterized protein YdaU (DUF1376 family)